MGLIIDPLALKSLKVILDSYVLLKLEKPNLFGLKEM
jgi:hypothetical protein